jgi:exodeoxyribonuclease V alpha subunit
LAAPTGKAAARLSESLGKNFDFLDSSDLALKDQISRSLPKQVTTLHRLLGPIPDSRFFKFNSLNRLPIDILVIDEASMVDTQMMAAVCNALPNQARLILLGDKDQLSSVEPGAVLGALCSGALTGPTQQNEIEWIKEVCNQPLTIDSNSNKDSLAPKPHNLEFRGIIKLSHSHRFQSDRGIGQLALFSNNSNAKAARSILNQGFNEIEAITVSRSNQSLLQAIAISGQQETGEQTSRRVGYGYYMSLLKRLRPVASLSFEEGDRDYFDSWATHVLQAYSKFQILCAVKDGPFGVEGINHLVTDCLAREGLIDPRSFWFEGRPVMITQNDHTLGLMNGDIGITFAIPSKDNGYELRVAFKSIDAVSGIKWVRPSRLNSVQTVFAMTVHKSQGSEFNHTLLILPEHLSPVLCKELIYTGITRASHWFTLCESGNPQVFEKALLHKIERRDGIIGN